MSDRSMLARFGKIATLVIGALALSACGINSIPTKEEAAKSQWGNVESSYQRRADLIPNLISTVQAAAISENNILRQVTDARARATGITVTTDDLSNPEEFRKFSEAQNQLTQALGQLRTVVENYPQLQSQQGFRDLMVAMEGAENQINVERMRYNEAAQDYNTEIRTFPATIAANVVYGSEPLEYFRSEPGASAAPEANFDAITNGAQGTIPPATNDNTQATQPAAAAN